MCGWNHKIFSNKSWRHLLHWLRYVYSCFSLSYRVVSGGGGLKAAIKNGKNTYMRYYVPYKPGDEFKHRTPEGEWIGFILKWIFPFLHRAKTNFNKIARTSTWIKANREHDWRYHSQQMESNQWKYRAKCKTF